MHTKRETYYRNNIQWQVNDTYHDLLKKMLDSVTDGNNYETIRSGHFKKILKYTDNQESFYIKKYTVKTRRKAFKSLFSVSKAYREWYRGFLLVKYSVPTAEPIAVGEEKYFGMVKDSYIISRAIPNSITVWKQLDAMQRAFDDKKPFKKNIFMKKLVSYIRNLHDKGIFHGELHAENILVDYKNISVFYLIDLGRVKQRKKLPVSWRIQELSRLLYSVRSFFTNKEIFEFINHYVSQGITDNIRINFQKIVFRKVTRISCRRLHGRIRKCLKNNDVFKVTAYNNYIIHARKDWDCNTLVSLINTHRLFLKERSDNIIKASSKTAITLIPALNKKNTRICIKEFRYPAFIKRLLYSFIHSPARNSWYASHGLLDLQIKTPKPFAFIEEKRRGLLKKSFLIMEDISDCQPTNIYISENFVSLHEHSLINRKRNFISSLALTFKKLHDSGVFHKDLKANNIMTMNSQNTWSFFFLDLDRVHFNKTVTKKEIIKNLSQINASISNSITYTDRLRFYCSYKETKHLTEQDKPLLKSIILLSIQRNHLWKPKVKFEKNVSNI